MCQNQKWTIDPCKKIKNPRLIGTNWYADECGLTKKMATGSFGCTFAHAEDLRDEVNAYVDRLQRELSVAEFCANSMAKELPANHPLVVRWNDIRSKIEEAR